MILFLFIFIIRGEEILILQPSEKYRINTNEIENIEGLVSTNKTNFFDKQEIKNNQQIFLQDKYQKVKVYQLNYSLSNQKWIFIFDIEDIFFYSFDSISKILSKKCKITSNGFGISDIEDLNISEILSYQNKLIVQLINKEQTILFIYYIEISFNQQNQAFEVVRSNTQKLFELKFEQNFTFMQNENIIILYQQQVINPMIYLINVKDKEVIKEDLSENFKDQTLSNLCYSQKKNQLYFLNTFKIFYYDFEDKKISKMEIKNEITKFVINSQFLYFIDKEKTFYQFKNDQLTQLFLIEKDIFDCQFFVQEKQKQKFFYCSNHNSSEYYFYDLENGFIQSFQTIDNINNLQLIDLNEFSYYLFFYSDLQQMYMSTIYMNNIQYDLSIDQSQNYCPYYLKNCKYAKTKIGNNIINFYIIDQTENMVLIRFKDLKIISDNFTSQDNYLYLNNFVYGFVDNFELYKEKIHENSSFEINNLNYLSKTINTGRSIYNDIINCNDFMGYIEVKQSGFYYKQYTISLKAFGLYEEYPFFQSEILLDTNISSILKIGYYQQNIYVLYKIGNDYKFCHFFYYEKQKCQPQNVFTNDFFKGETQYVHTSYQQDKFVMYFKKKENSGFVKMAKMESSAFQIFKFSYFDIFLDSEILNLKIIQTSNSTWYFFFDKLNLTINKGDNFEHFLTIKLQNNSFYLNTYYFISINDLQQSITFYDLLTAQAYTQQIHFKYNFKSIQKNSTISIINNFIVVRIQKEEINTLSNIQIANKKAYLSFNFNIDRICKICKYMQIEGNSIFVLFENTQTEYQGSMTILKSSFWLEYKIGTTTFEPINFMNLWGEDIVYCYTVQYNKDHEFGFYDLLNVEISSEFIINNKRKGETLLINSGSLARTNLLEFYEGNIFNIFLNFGEQENISDWKIIDNQKRGYLIENENLNISFDFLPFIYSPLTLIDDLQNFGQTFWITYCQIVDDKQIYYLILLQDSYLYQVKIQSKDKKIKFVKRNKILFKKDQTTSIDILTCVNMAFVEFGIVIICDTVMFFSSYDALKSDDILFQDYDEIFKTQTKNNIEIIYNNFMILKDTKNSQLDFYLANSEQYVKLDSFKHDIIAKKQHQTEILEMDKSQFFFILQSQGFLLAIAFNRYQVFPKPLEIITKYSWNYMLRNIIPNQLLLVDQKDLIALEFSLNELNEIQFIYVDIIKLKLLARRNYLDIILYKQFLLILFHDDLKNIVSLSIQNDKGEIVSYSSYENYYTQPCFFVYFDKSSDQLLVSSMINLINSIFINWDYIIVNSHDQRIKKNELFSVVAENPYYSNNLEMLVYSEYIQEGKNFVLFYLDVYQKELVVTFLFMCLGIYHYLFANQLRLNQIQIYYNYNYGLQLFQKEKSYGEECFGWLEKGERKC